MKRKLLWLLIIIGLSSGVTYTEYSYLKETVKVEPMATIYFTADQIYKGDKINENDLVTKLIHAKDVEKNYIKDPSKIVGRYATVDLQKGSLLLEEHGTPLSQLTLAKPGYMLVTFAFDGETSNAWNIRAGQNVELLFCSRQELSSTLYKEVTVVNVYSKTGEAVMDNGEKMQKYVTFEIKKEKGCELLANRQNGRVEIIIL